VSSPARWPRIVQGLLALNTIIWSGIAIYSLLEFLRERPEPVIVFTVVSLLLFGNAVAWGFSAWGIGKRNRRWYAFTLVLVITNIILTFTDQVGIWDWLTAALCFMICGILLFKRAYFLPAHHAI